MWLFLEQTQRKKLKTLRQVLGEAITQPYEEISFFLGPDLYHGLGKVGAMATRGLSLVSTSGEEDLQFKKKKKIFNCLYLILGCGFLFPCHGSAGSSIPGCQPHSGIVWVVRLGRTGLHPPTESTRARDANWAGQDGI